MLKETHVDISYVLEFYSKKEFHKIIYNYLQLAEEHREEVKKQFPDIKFTFNIYKIETTIIHLEES